MNEKIENSKKGESKSTAVTKEKHENIVKIEDLTMKSSSCISFSIEDVLRFNQEIELIASDIEKIAIRENIDLDEEQLLDLACELHSFDSSEWEINQYKKAIELAQIYRGLCLGSVIKIGLYTVTDSDWIVKLLKDEIIERSKQLSLRLYSKIHLYHFFDDADDNKRKRCIEYFKERLKEMSSGSVEYKIRSLGEVLHPDMVVVKNGKQMKFFPKKEAAFIFDLLVYRGVIDNKEYYDDAEKYDRIKRFLQAEIDI